MKKIAILLVATGLIAGCNQTAKPTNVVAKTSSTSPNKAHDHSHDVGPHQGTIFDLGKYHAEFTVDHKKKEATLYILGDDADTPVPVTVEKLMLTIKSPAFSVELKPVPDAKDPAGKSSRFVASHDNFGKEQEFEGTVAGSIEGKPVNENFKESDHDHDHKNEKNDKKK